MPTIRIENTPESIALAVHTMSPTDRARFDIALDAALRKKEMERNQEKGPNLSQGDLDAIGERLKAVEEDGTVDGNEFFADMQKECEQMK